MRKNTLFYLLLAGMLTAIGVGVLWAANLFETDRDGISPALVKAEFSVPGMSIPAQTKGYSNISSGFTIPAPVAAGQIDYFDNNLAITWSVQYEGCEKWFPAGTSAHEIYWTRAAPATSLRQETLFWVSCTGGKGKTAEADIVDGIWNKFSTGNAPANLCRKDGTAMKYWGALALANGKANGTAFFTAPELLASCDGKCGAWADLLGNVLAVNSIGSSLYELYPIYGEWGNKDNLVVKNYIYDSTPAFPNDVYTHHLVNPFVYFSVYPGYAVDAQGVAGQSNPEPASQFKNHAVVSVSGFILDPSYGIRTENLIQWKDIAISGFGRNGRIRRATRLVVEIVRKTD